MNAIAPNGLALLGDEWQHGPNIEDPDAIVVRSATVNTTDHPNLLAVARAGAGVNNVSVKEATQNGICVFNTPGANADAVAELVFTMLGVYFRNLHNVFANQGSIDLNSIERLKKQYVGHQYTGKVMGVIGLGMIGLKVANIGVRNGMQVMGYDPYPNLENIHQLDSRIKLIKNLDEMLGLVDILTIHIPLGPKTKGFVDAEILRSLPDKCVLINYARAEICNEDAVLTALTNGRLGAYITDFPTDRIVSNERVIWTPHLGASTHQAEENCAVMAITQLKNYIHYGIVNNSVNFPAIGSLPGQTIRERLVVINRDVPNMIGAISHILGEQGINIHSFANKSNGEVGYNIIDLECTVPEKVLGQIRDIKDVVRVRHLKF